VKRINLDFSKTELLSIEGGKGTLKENLILIIFIFAFFTKMMADEPEP